MRSKFLLCSKISSGYRGTVWVLSPNHFLNGRLTRNLYYSDWTTKAFNRKYAIGKLLSRKVFPEYFLSWRHFVVIWVLTCQGMREKNGNHPSTPLMNWFKATCHWIFNTHHDLVILITKWDATTYSIFSSLTHWGAPNIFALFYDQFALEWTNKE